MARVRVHTKGRKQMRTTSNCLMVTVAFLAAASTAMAGFPLEGSQEVPPVVTPASGNCEVDITAGIIDVNCTFANLSSNAINAHIHAPAPPGVNAGTIIPLHYDAATSGSLTQNAPISAIDAGHVMSGLAYVNLHSESFPGGELRGQITSVTSGDSAVPTVSTWGVVLMVLLILVVAKTVHHRRRTLAQ